MFNIQEDGPPMIDTPGQVTIPVPTLDDVERGFRIFVTPGGAAYLGLVVAVVFAYIWRKEIAELIRNGLSLLIVRLQKTEAIEAIGREAALKAKDEIIGSLRSEVAELREMVEDCERTRGEERAKAEAQHNASVSELGALTVRVASIEGTNKAQEQIMNKQDKQLRSMVARERKLLMILAGTEAAAATLREMALQTGDEP